MKRKIFILFLYFLVTSCVSSRFDSTFYERFLTENRRVRAELYLYKFDSNLELLTYEYYLHYLDSTKVSSAKELSETIRSADEHYFETRKNSFLIALLYKKERTIFIDNAYTNKLDTVYNIKETEEFPVLKEFAHKIKF